MIVDTSALLAILLNEPEAEGFASLIADSETRRLSAASYVEAGIRVDRPNDPVLRNLLDELIKRFELAIEPVTIEQAFAARAAYRDYGKDRHPAGLNFGDCFTYALAKVTGEPLLFKGNDFSRTDLRSAS